MFKKKKIYFLLIPFFVVIVFATLDIIQYREFIGVADAGGGCISLDAGTVGVVVNTCAIVNGACPACSIIYSPEYAMSCVNYLQVSVIGTQNGATTYAVPTSFVNYKGGGMMIKAGDQFIYCGTTAAMPIVWGAPGTGVGRVQKILDFYEYMIASFKD